MKTYKVVDSDACPKHLKICQYKHVAVAGTGSSAKREVQIEEEGLVSLYDLAHDWGITQELVLAIMREAQVATVTRGGRLFVDEDKAIEAIETVGPGEDEMLLGEFVTYMYTSEHTVRKYIAAGKLKPARSIGKCGVYTRAQACELSKMLREEEAKKHTKRRIVNETLRKKHWMDKAEFIEKIVKPARKLKREYEHVYARIGERKGYGGDDEEAGFRGE